jgi:hypothetical protein
MSATVEINAPAVHGTSGLLAVASRGGLDVAVGLEALEVLGGWPVAM